MASQERATAASTWERSASMRPKRGARSTLGADCGFDLNVLMRLGFAENWQRLFCKAPNQEIQGCWTQNSSPNGLAHRNRLAPTCAADGLDNLRRQPKANILRHNL